MAKKICLVSPEYPPKRYGGLACTVFKTASHLAALGYDVHVLHFEVENGHPPLLDENRHTIHEHGLSAHCVRLGRETHPQGRALFDCPHNLSLQMLFESLQMLDREFGFDLFISFFLYPVGYLTALYSRLAKRPHLACAVGNDVKRYLFSPEKAGLCGYALEHAEGLVFLSQDLLDLADAFLPIRHKSRIIHNSVEIPETPWNRPGYGQHFTLGAAGIFKHAKGLPYLFKALHQLGAGFVLELAGEFRPEEETLRQELFTRFKLDGNVRFRGVLDREAMQNWMRGLDAFALPSLSEGCPNVLMEAMAMGLPCVSTRVGACEELIENEVSGLLADWADSRGLAQAIARLKNDSQLAVRIGHAARKRMEKFSAQRESEAWAQAVNGVLRGECA